MAQGDFLFPIPGTKRIKYLEENLGAISVHFSKEELNDLDAIFPKDAVKGLRYPEQMMASLNG
jgi:aryl-alcohol dehydrogenase-like predicted oxidoreductase